MGSLPANTTSGYTSVDGTALYTTVAVPAQGRPEHGWILTGAFGDERKSAYRPLVRLGQALTDAGDLVVRFDLSGTGDSTGNHADAGIERWTSEVRSVLEQAARHNPTVASWGLIGARLGANLNLRAALQPVPIPVNTLVLVEPLLSGDLYLRDLVRRQQIREAMAGGAARSAEDDLRSAWDQGADVDLGGFAIGPRLGREMAGIDLEVDHRELPENCRLLLVHVAAGQRLPPTWQRIHDLATHRSPDSWVCLRDKPFWGQVDYHESDLVQNAILAFRNRA
jgi:pimeloyl-ACP methyl ester carboxylesterase